MSSKLLIHMREIDGFYKNFFLFYNKSIDLKFEERIKHFINNIFLKTCLI